MSAASGPIILEDVVARKSPQLAASIPGLAYRLLGRLIHLREINRGLRTFGSGEGLPFVDAVCRFFDLDMQPEGLEHLHTGRAPLVAANHPLGGLDGIAMLHIVGSVWPDVVVPVNDFLMHIPNLRPCFVPVNKHGSNRSNAARLAEAFASGRAMLHFPAGLCSRRKGHLIRDLEWKKTFISRARATRRPVVPAWIGGANSYRFYRIAQLRERTGWKFNAEMLLLVDEMFKQRAAQLRIVYAPPIDPAYFDERMSDRSWAAMLRRYVYTLKDNPARPFAEYCEHNLPPVRESQ